MKSTVLTTLAIVTWLNNFYQSNSYRISHAEEGTCAIDEPPTAFNDTLDGTCLANHFEEVPGVKLIRNSRLAGAATVTDLEYHRYMVGLTLTRFRLENNFHEDCSGFVVNKKNLLVATSAHCVYDVPTRRWADKISIRLLTAKNAEPKKNDDLTRNTIQCGAKSVFTLGNWEVHGDNRDIAIIQVDKSCLKGVTEDLSSELDEVNLPDIHFNLDVPTRDEWYAKGYGQTIDAGGGRVTDNLLRRLRVNLPGDEVACGANPTLPSDVYVCATAEQKGHGICKGDSGGPLMLETLSPDGKNITVGIITDGDPGKCDDHVRGAFYVRLDEPVVRQFIKNVFRAVETGFHPENIYHSGSKWETIVRNNFIQPKKNLWYQVQCILRSVDGCVISRKR